MIKSFGSDMRAWFAELAWNHGLPAEKLALAVGEREQEAGQIEHDHLQSRWQTHFEKGETVPAEKVRTKLSFHAAEAAIRQEA